MRRIDLVCEKHGIENNMMNRGYLLYFKCPHNYTCIDYFDCEGKGLREEKGEYDICTDCWLKEIE